MNRKLLVSLLQKNIDELAMITDGFMEMKEYPKAIIVLARRKTEDIQLLIDQLAEVKVEQNDAPIIASVATAPTETALSPEPEIQVEEELVPNALPDMEDIKLMVENIEDYKLDHLLDEKNEAEIVAEAIKPIEVVEDTVAPMPMVEPTITVKAEPVVEVELPKEPVVAEVEVQMPEELVPSIETMYVEKVELTESHTTTTAHTETSSVETTVVTEETKRTIIGEKVITPTVSRNEAHQKADNSLSATLANKKVDDIKQAISIGDRFRFQRELFRGNGEEMNKTLTYLNQLATLKEAQAFLQSKYNWAADSDAAEDFYQILKRKY